MGVSGDGEGAIAGKGILTVIVCQRERPAIAPVFIPVYPGIRPGLAQQSRLVREVSTLYARDVLNLET